MILAAIPTIGEAPQLGDLVAQLVDEAVADEIWLMVNQVCVDLKVPAEPKVRQLRLFGQSIYAEWNLAISHVAAVDGRAVLLNDDVELAPGALVGLLALMNSDPELVAVGFDYQNLPEERLRYCEGSYRHGGIGGWAFAVDAARSPLVDEQFEWYGGDDDLFFAIAEQGGKLAVAEGCGVQHSMETTAINHAWTHDAKIRDHARFEAKWGTGSAW